MSREPHTFESSAMLGSRYDLPLIRLRTRPLAIIVASGSLSMAGTSSADSARIWEEPFIHDTVSTTSAPDGQVLADSERSVEMTRQAISDLRRISGLTWEQLAQLFEVSRRSVHFWASGKPLNATNERRLLRTLDIVKDADRGDARKNRSALFESSDGTTAFDLLVSQQFDDALAKLGRGRGRGRKERAQVELSASAKAARKPLPPEELVDAMQDRVHRDIGRGLAVRTARNKSRERD